MRQFLFGLLAVMSLFAAQAAQAQTPQQCVTNAVAGGTADAITVPLLPCGLSTNILILTITANNTTTTPTIQMAGFPAQRIYTNTLANPGIGDFGAAGSVLMLTSTGSSWLVINGNVGGYIPLPLIVANGGTGVATLTANGLLYGNGTSPVGITAAGQTGQYLRGTTGNPPNWQSLSSDVVTTLGFGTTGLTPAGAASGAITVAGTLIVGNGGSGAVTFTNHGLLLGQATSPFAATAVGATGQYLKGNTGADPTWGTLASDTMTSITFGSTGLTPSSPTGGAVTVAGTLAVANGGTGQTTYTDGQLLIGNSGTGGLSKAALTAGTNVTITNAAGGITIASTGLASGCGTGAAPAGQVLTANGATACTANADLLFSLGTLSLGTAGSEVGTVSLKNATSGTIGLAPTTGALGSAIATFPANSGTVAELNLAQTWTAAQTFTSSDLLLKGATSGTITLNAAAIAGANTITLPAGTTDFSATGGTSQVVKQISAGAAFTVARLACADLSDASAGCSAASSGIVWAGAPKTTSFNAVVNTRYCIDTLTTGAVTMTLPASPADGDQIGFIDCKSNFATTNFTVARNGKNIMGSATDMTVNLANSAATMIYSSSLTDWRMY